MNSKSKVYNKSAKYIRLDLIFKKGKGFKAL
jgi:hypothetical protein